MIPVPPDPVVAAAQQRRREAIIAAHDACIAEIERATRAAYAAHTEAIQRAEVEYAATFEEDRSAATEEAP